MVFNASTVLLAHCLWSIEWTDTFKIGDKELLWIIHAKIGHNDLLTLLMNECWWWNWKLGLFEHCFCHTGFAAQSSSDHYYCPAASRMIMPQGSCWHHPLTSPVMQHFVAKSSSRRMLLLSPLLWHNKKKKGGKDGKEELWWTMTQPLTVIISSTMLFDNQAKK
jgi:hypothetical protein